LELREVNSLFRNILRISPYSSKILGVVGRNLIIPKDQGGRGNYLGIYLAVLAEPQNQIIDQDGKIACQPFNDRVMYSL
jgi:hypothetical protein